MKKISTLMVCLLIVFAAGCDEPEEEAAEPEEIEVTEGLQEEEETEDEQVDLAAMVEASQQRCRAVICDRPIECWDEVEAVEDKELGLTAEECYERDCTVPEGIIDVIDPDEMASCMEADDAAAACLAGLSCDGLIAVVHPELDGSEHCAEEMKAAEAACARYAEALREHQAQ